MVFSDLQSRVREMFYSPLVKGCNKHEVFLSKKETPNGFVWYDARSGSARLALYEIEWLGDATRSLIGDLEAFASSNAPLVERERTLRILGHLRLAADVSALPPQTDVPDGKLGVRQSADERIRGMTLVTLYNELRAFLLS